MALFPAWSVPVSEAVNDPAVPVGTTVLTVAEVGPEWASLTAAVTLPGWPTAKLGVTVGQATAGATRSTLSPLIVADAVLPARSVAEPVTDLAVAEDPSVVGALHMALIDALAAGFAAYFAADLTPNAPTAQELDLAATLRAERYANPIWTARR